MTNDILIHGLARSANMVIDVALTTHTCRRAQQLHQLAASSAIALGRLVTASAMMAYAKSRPGALSLQVVCQGRLRQLYADITETGDIRGYVKHATLELPLLPDEDKHGRRTIAPFVGEGQLSVIRLAANREFAQSTTELHSGEIDHDVQAFINNSDQIPTILACDVLLGDNSEVEIAGGLLIQGLPNHDASYFDALKQALAEKTFAERLQQLASASRTDAATSLKQLLHTLDAKAEIVGQTESIQWKCRCSDERVRGALKMLPATDLAEMVEKKEIAHVTCDFCAKTYDIPTEIVEQTYLETMSGRSS